MKGETYGRKVKDIQPSRYAVVDPSIPEASDHEKHILDIARANKGRGFPVGGKS